MKYLLIPVLYVLPAVAQLLNAQYVYTDINPDYELGTRYLDLDNDGQPDYKGTINFAPSGPSSGGSGIRYSLLISQNYVVFDTLQHKEKIFQNGDTVQTAPGLGLVGNSYPGYFIFELINITVSGNNTTISEDDTYMPGGVSNKYLGLAFEVNGQLHYGWLKFSKIPVAGNLDHIILKSFAYNPVAGEPIVIDDPNVALEPDLMGLPEITAAGIPVRIYPNPVVSGQVFTLQAEGEITYAEILDMQGHVLYTRHGTGGSELQFSEPALEAGAYLVRLYCKGQQDALTGRILIQ